MKLIIPELSLVVLAGPSGCGKSTFASKHFESAEILSSDDRQTLADQRLAAGELTVLDAPHVQAASRKPLVAMARQYHVPPVAIVWNIDQQICVERNASRRGASGARAVRSQATDLRNSLRGIDREGFRHVYIFNSPEEAESATVERQPLANNRKNEHGPFDIIGDVHGCLDELLELLDKLGYRVVEAAGDYRVTPPLGRKAIFVGDLVDRGPKIPGVLRLAKAMVKSGAALCVPGNHDAKLLRKLQGRDVEMAHGLPESVAQLDAETPDFLGKVAAFFDGLPSHYVLDDGRLVVAHAGLKEEMHGRDSSKVRDFALYGETTGETNLRGLPVRLNWAADYHGQAMVVYGHTPVAEPAWLNGTVNIDTGCVYGGKLTALRYPEREWLSVLARRNYKLHL